MLILQKKLELIGIPTSIFPNITHRIYLEKIEIISGNDKQDLGHNFFIVLLLIIIQAVSQEKYRYY